MSLDSLRDLRRERMRPEEVIAVLVGPRPAWRHDSPAFVHVPQHSNPEDMDWRPLLGLWTAVFATVDDHPLVARVLICIAEAKAKFYGAALPEGTFPCVKEADERHHANLRTTLENYRCQ